MTTLHLLLVQEEDLLLVQEGDLLPAQEQDLLLCKKIIFLRKKKIDRWTPEPVPDFFPAKIIANSYWK